MKIKALELAAMFILYEIALILIFIVLFPFWICLLVYKKKFRAGLMQKLGFYSKELAEYFTGLLQKPVWFHAVSVGETIAVIDLVKTFHEENPDIPIVFSTVTLTGQNIAQKNLADIAKIIYFPLDISFIIRKIIKIISPALVVIVETEIWPGFVNVLSSNKIPVLLINGRLSPKSFKNYIKIKFFIKEVLSCFTSFLMQSNRDADRIIQMGADEKNVRVVGNLKYDIKRTMTSEDIALLRHEIFIDDKAHVMIAGSTHSGEEKIILDLFLKLKESVDSLKLILVPRHPERYKEVFNLLEEYQLSYSCRSTNGILKDNSILVLDTMGELSKFYSVSNIAIIGGSFISKGGHNPLEPAVYSVPVIMGPHVFNFEDIVNYMVGVNACVKVADPFELFSVLENLLKNPDYYNHLRNGCKKVFNENSGATEVVLKEIKTLLFR